MSERTAGIPSTPAEMVYEFLKDSGGNANANGAYATASPAIPNEFFYSNGGSHPIELHRLIIIIEDTADMQADEYGNLGAALSNGWSLKAFDDASPANVTCDFNGGIAVKTNAEIGRICYDVDVKAWGTTPTDNLLLGRFTFARSGTPLILAPGHKLSITFTDDLNGLIEHYFMIQGRVWTGEGAV